MSIRKKDRRFGTWLDAERAYEVVNKMSSILEVAMTELARGQVRWLEGIVPRKVGICKLLSTYGGVVILVERDRVGARYLTEWAEEAQARQAPKYGDSAPAYKAWLDIRRLAATAIALREEARTKACEEADGCLTRGLPGIVDQDVRSY